jgi:hypothetical protein
MLPLDVTIPATVPQGSEIPEGLMNNPVYETEYEKMKFLNFSVKQSVKLFFCRKSMY